MQEEKHLQEIELIISSFDAEIKEVTNIAGESAKGGDQNWTKILDKYQIEAIPAEQKQMFYSSGINIVKGALPAELRKVYQQIRTNTIKKFNAKFQAIELEFDAEMKWDDFVDKLGTFIDDEIDAYIGRIKQKVTVNNIFANAFSGINKYSVGLKDSTLKTKQCKTCGAPRQDTDQYDTCYFCGTKLFETARHPAKCKNCGSPVFDSDTECSSCGFKIK